MEKKKYFYEQNIYMIIDAVAVLVIIAGWVFSPEVIVGKTAAKIIMAPFYAYAFIYGIILLVMTKVNTNKENKARLAERAERAKAPRQPFLLRGTVLDQQIRGQIPREDGEDDWTYVKRIFPIICETNPTGAVSILFGKSITELSGANQFLAGEFLSSRRNKHDITTFLRGFSGDPAYNN